VDLPVVHRLRALEILDLRYRWFMKFGFGIICLVGYADLALYVIETFIDRISCASRIRRLTRHDSESGGDAGYVGEALEKRV